MSFELSRKYTAAEKKRLAVLQQQLIGKAQRTQAKYAAPRVERLAHNVPMSVTGRIGLPPPQTGFTHRPLRMLLEAETPEGFELYAFRDGTTLSRPISLYSNFGVPFGEPAGDFRALKVSIEPSALDSGIYGLTDTWEPLENLGNGNVTEGHWPDVQHFAFACLIKIHQQNAYPAATATPTISEQ